MFHNITKADGLNTLCPSVFSFDLQIFYKYSNKNNIKRIKVLFLAVYIPITLSIFILLILNKKFIAFLPELPYYFLLL